MTGFNHTLAGSIIAVITPAPLVPIFALVSHFILDAMPHFGNHAAITVENSRLSKRFKQLLIVDALLCIASLSLALLLFPDKWLVITIGVIFAAGPDFLWMFESRAKSRLSKRFFIFAKRIQWAEWPRGWILEIIYGLTFVTILFAIK